MTASPIIERVAQVVGALKTTARVDVFQFGSTLVENAPWWDVDILLVCACESDRALARKGLAELCDQFPIDLTIMAAQEEAELDFIRSQGCRWLASTSVATSL